MPKPKKYRLLQSEVDSMRIIAPNKVLVQITERNVDRKTQGGIVMIAETDVSWNPSVHADRHGIIKQVPPCLKKERSHLWKTVIEVKVGDRCWWDQMISQNTDTILTENGTYLLIDYFDLHVVKRNELIIPLNGYSVFSLVNDVDKSSLAVDFGRKDARYGVLKHKASLNTYYYNGLDDDDRIQEQDVCVFKLPPVLLEESYHAVFDGKELYRISQLYNISAFIHEGVLNASINHVVIEPEVATHIGGVEIPLPYRKPIGIGKIYGVHCPDTELEVGMTVSYFAEASTTIEFEGRKLQICHIDYIKFYKL